MQISLRMNNYHCREKAVQALAESGHKVWIEEERSSLRGSTYFLCIEFELKEPSHE